MNSSVFRGVAPALMTPCDAEGKPRFDPLTAKAIELIGLGMRAVVYCGSMGDWPLLTDEQRMQGVESLVAANVPVIVGTGAQNSMRATALAKHAKKVGAAGLMMIPRVLSRGSSVQAQYDHFAGMLEAADGVPAVIYNSPYYGFATRAELFFALREKYPNLVGFKEFGGADSMTYAAQNIAGADPNIALTIGVDTQVFHGYVNCGAVGAITGIGNVLPREVLHMVSLCKKAAAGDMEARRAALELEGALAVLNSFDEGIDLVLYYKFLMVLQGNAEYEHHFIPTDRLTPAQQKFASDQLTLFKSWYGAWAERLPDELAA
ncbi:MAG: dihydrodipicolinate synthase family protein [Hyphomicrobiaceae bacterium]|nr:dihydrodipicolinate synthase family protein [Hyphomicrobiaceae bacterium]